jgi:hypothetical protein
MSKRTKDIGVAKSRLERQTSYYSGLERGVGTRRQRSREVNIEPAGHNSVQRQDSICVVAKYIDKRNNQPPKCIYLISV